MPSENCINTVLVCDDSYAQHATVMLRSMLASNKKSFFKIFCLVPEDFGNTKNMEESIRDLSEDYLNFIYVDPSDFISAKLSGHVSSAVYYRLRLDAFLPLDVTRAIYLDCDIIVKDDLSSLWTLDLDGHAVGAAVDDFLNKNQLVRSRVGLSPATYYLNSGVMLIDINKWKEKKIGTRALEFCLAHPEQITYWDQCALNHVINGDFKVLERRWNFQSSMMIDGGAWRCTPELLGQLNAAAIIHFAGVIKPWHYRCLHPAKDLYWTYLRETAWHDYRVPDRTIINRIKNGLDRYVPFVGVIYRWVTRRVAATHRRLSSVGSLLRRATRATGLI